MKTFLFTLFISLSFNMNYAQSDSSAAGYYIINSGAKYSVLQPGSNDYWSDGDGCLHQKDLLLMKAGEVVVVFEYSNNKYFCFDPNGRMLVFEGKESLTKAPFTQGCGIGLLTKTIPLIDGTSLTANSYYWIIGQNISQGTVRIRVEDKKEFDIPTANIIFFSAQLKRIAKDIELVKVEE